MKTWIARPTAKRKYDAIVLNRNIISTGLIRRSSYFSTSSCMISKTVNPAKISMIIDAPINNPRRNVSL